MSLLLLFHPGISAAPQPQPEPEPQPRLPEGGGVRAAQRRRRLIERDDEDILTLILAFLRIKDG